jgi:osmoprotectant transport system ATP-binding protein
VISFRNVSKSFDGGNTFALRGVTADVASGETLVLLGSSGSGKTTLLRLVNRLIAPTSGGILLNREEVAGMDPIQLRRRIGYVFQGIGLFPHLTVEANVAMKPRLLGRTRKAQSAEAAELLERVGLDPALYGQRYPDQLSGGQQQRVGVARALAGNPDYLLMDEPFGALDALTRDGLQQQLLQLKAQLRKTILFVTHDTFEALTLGDRIAVMHHGNLEQIGTREELLGRPRTAFVRDLFAKPVAQLKLLANGS